MNQTKYLQRYKAGDYHAWDELVSAAPSVLDKPELFAEATDLAILIMRRVSRNVETVRKTLTASGAILAPEGEPLNRADLSFLTDRFGPLPLALDVFYKSIGAIRLIPNDYDYGANSLENAAGVELLALDPLQIESAATMQWALDEYDAEFTEEEEAQNPFRLYLCPDFLHKADVSGGEAYSVYLPPDTDAGKLDPNVDVESEQVSFVNYLRHNFKWGGFAGLAVIEQDGDIDLNRMMAFESVSGGDWRAAGKRLLQVLRQDLVEF